MGFESCAEVPRDTLSHSFVNLQEITPLKLIDKFVIQSECFSYWIKFVKYLSNWMKFQLKQTDHAYKNIFRISKWNFWNEC